MLTLTLAGKALQIAALLAIGVGAGGVLHRLSIGAHHHLPARALIEEDHWSRALYTTVSPRCAEVIETFDMPLANLPRTALASYPRSGNTFTRLLIERATGWHTSSLYCDRELARAFDGECALRKTGFLVKCVVIVPGDLTAPGHTGRP